MRAVITIKRYVIRKRNFQVLSITNELMKESGQEWIREASRVKESERRSTKEGGRLQLNGYGIMVILPFSLSGRTALMASLTLTLSGRQ